MIFACPFAPFSLRSQLPMATDRRPSFNRSHPTSVVATTISQSVLREEVPFYTPRRRVSLMTFQNAKKERETTFGQYAHRQQILIWLRPQLLLPHRRCCCLSNNFDGRSSSFPNTYHIYNPNQIMLSQTSPGAISVRTLWTILMTAPSTTTWQG